MQTLKSLPELTSKMKSSFTVKRIYKHRFNRPHQCHHYIKNVFIGKREAIIMQWNR